MIAKQITLSELVARYAEARSLSVPSATLYNSVARAFERFLKRPATLTDLTPESFQLWSDSLTARIVSATGYRKRLRSLWRFAHQQGLVDGGPEKYTRPRLSPREEAKRQRKAAREPRGPKQWPFDTTAKRMGPKLIWGKPAAITSQMTLREYFDGIYCRMRLAVRSARTRALYVNTLDLFDKYLERPATLADLDDDTVTAHLNWIIANGRAARTANKSRDQLLALWRYAARKRHVELFRDVDPLPEPKRLPRAWTIEQLAKLIDASRAPAPKLAQEKTLCGVPYEIWWPALLLMLYDTGMRIGAAMQLRCDDYDPAARTIFVRAEIQKQNADQCLSISEETAAALTTCIGAIQRELLFPYPYSLCTFYDYLVRLLNRAGLPKGRFDKFHKIRRTSATMAELCIGPGAATIHLGHSSPKVTERYLDRTMLPNANVAAALPRPILPPAKGGAA